MIIKRHIHRLIFLSCIVTILILAACKDSFEPNVTSFNSNLLVVEGLINAGSDSTKFKLSRTVVVAEKNVGNPETGATVAIESESNELLPLVELSSQKGTYASPGLNLNATKKYRLNIKTLNGSIYVSDYVEVKISPEIEQVGWDVKTDELQLFANTKDASNNTRYYRWEYEETWIFYSKFYSVLFWNGTALQSRTPDNYVYQCWGNEKSNKIILGSSAKLSADVIFKQPITNIPSNSEKLGERYSILVKQYALSKEAYEFWQNLKKNTESLGSIFDVQPSQLTGNIRNLNNANEPVIGYVSAGSVSTKRVYVNKADVPNFRVEPDRVCIEPLLVVEVSGSDYRTTFSGGFNVPIEEFGAGVYASSRACVDCTLRGTNKKPTFWQ
ncbi:DUF4249 domain-containing protein [Pedobacter namyangjuensis]|uniref:DUF4249 domain-containing protein n=1 Tax=Pedobacter namyangjuensis TaxID=600626 RepID=UPI000DE44A24|nr:DUF4249 domain-containing protein [Pedobacter namyangjuensis]